MSAPSYLDKIVALKELLSLLKKRRENGARVVFTNGCFDLLHTGHTRYLAEARGLGEVLVVGLNSDSSTRAIKGPGRPIRSQEKRAELLAALESVDYVVAFDEETPLSLIKAIQPDFLVKGGDWPLERIVGAEVVREGGGRVLKIPLTEGESTTGLIEQVRQGGG